LATFETQRDRDYVAGMESHLRRLDQPLTYIANNFAKYVRRQKLTRFLVQHELFKRVLEVTGSVIECGVFSGHGLMAWAQLSAILEPVGYQRRIYGFDTFEGFPHVSPKDEKGVQVGDLKDDCYEELQECIRLFDRNRFINHIPKVQTIKGDFCQTGPQFLQDNPQLLVALLYLDFDLYEPTKKALELFLARMPKGAIIAFDEIRDPGWPGETLAMLECINIRNVTIRKFPYEPNIAFIRL